MSWMKTQNEEQSNHLKQQLSKRVTESKKFDLAYLESLSELQTSLFLGKKGILPIGV